eukprot:CAMPEP_0204566522 /NCGR_PEP_ID=MMETSP0661-20131031/36098_1 /ASSEMBLY_ACC=CAM_ASM_000606 /TAXON_ID=109239 /ORGANISM="Alexandrium margalefi, Strain AMGDE01CS-322" /LENGTH=215 /DNA_ID=CAMNT_0051574377 /DNA_START=50 /DNA_END=693 /DNA_ORIENTATION=-
MGNSVKSQICCGMGRHKTAAAPVDKEESTGSKKVDERGGLSQGRGQPQDGRSAAAVAEVRGGSAEKSSRGDRSPGDEDRDLVQEVPDLRRQDSRGLQGPLHRGGPRAGLLRHPGHRLEQVEKPVAAGPPGILGEPRRLPPQEGAERRDRPGQHRQDPLGSRAPRPGACEALCRPGEAHFGHLLGGRRQGEAVARRAETSAEFVVVARALPQGGLR